ncbi:flagellar inner arm dynein light chain Tctex1 [Micromonas pusilla CCMP1545]|uniref:Flagellar inner arm dynein light chain Tctex1 n=1 Tax=Micromonas pusilla (strain CCMP1545) TaxID=564608 RepID=C1N4Y1_MICPC|nr:flagellar inner arm dynein light chain Tctex1 [Micromonas pusilla CCMP1545]EEH52812.1 flagellar inner arm dynein light chain Tctex1 [Micromonas pusilla CCMP1545]|eukprot:XP_003062873.1 flagellar inner arm dynein light chain Tctex1 [Micromonas pusilla CCMP1545]
MQAIFVADDVNEIIKESIDAVLQNAAYSHAKVGQWTSSAVETTLRRLTALKKPFKYVVTCVIMQKNGAGLHTASSCYWDNETDGARTVRWENKSMYCIVTVFGLAV